MTQIKIDFTRCTTNKVIIRGNNGSGKSTLMDAINPNPDSNDKFIPGVEARKNICLCDNGIDYVIRYIHPVTNSGRGTTKGYISKMMDGNLVELNPNGNISTFNDIIQMEFGIDQSFLRLIRIGPNVTNFINMNKSLSNKANNNKTCVVENSIKEENDIKNYDEIPIKPLNVNFIELVEKRIANDNSLNKDESTIKKNN